MSYFNETNPVGDRSFTQSVPLTPLEEAQKVPPGWFAGTGDTLMKGLAETGRAVDLVGSVGPIAQDFFSGGTTAQDQYFREHDDVFNSAVDHWTPDPGSVHWSGQVVGGVLAGLTQFAAGGPGLMVASAQLGTAESLVREGVDPETANLVGVVQGTAAAVGVKAPFVGSTWARKALSGLAANVPLGVGSRYLSHELLDAQGFGEQAAQFQALDPLALATDILMPLAFSGVAHLGETRQIGKAVRTMTESQRDAVLVMNQAKHLELDTLPGIPKDGESLNAHVAAMTKAADQLLRGESVDVTKELANAQFDGARPDDISAHAEGLVSEPKLPPELAEPVRATAEAVKAEPAAAPGAEAARAVEATPEVRAAQARLAQGDIEIVTGEDADGNPIRQKASEALAAEPPLPATAFQAAVQCFLGG